MLYNILHPQVQPLQEILPISSSFLWGISSLLAKQSLPLPKNMF